MFGSTPLYGGLTPGGEGGELPAHHAKLRPVKSSGATFEKAIVPPFQYAKLSATAIAGRGANMARTG